VKRRVGCSVPHAVRGDSEGRRVELALLGGRQSGGALRCREQGWTRGGQGRSVGSRGATVPLCRGDGLARGGVLAHHMSAKGTRGVHTEPKGHRDSEFAIRGRWCASGTPSRCEQHHMPAGGGAGAAGRGRGHEVGARRPGARGQGPGARGKDGQQEAGARQRGITLRLGQGPGGQEPGPGARAQG